jgi:iron complex outermembrane receptor protein
MNILQGEKRPRIPRALAKLLPASIRSPGLIAVVALFSLPAQAQVATSTPEPETGQVLEQVIVTGSSIPQNADNTSLPVTIITSDQIAKTGLTSTTDVIQNLPAMQGFVPASSSVNGGGGGITTASLHSLPSKYTLVLIDGERVAPFELGSVQGDGFGVNIGSIPLDAVERVEVLSDGASALYGADAIAGVVNFILKKDTTEGNAYYNVSLPQSSGGGGWNAGISKGFGSLASDDYNIVLSYSHDVQNSLEASQRPVSASGAYFPFTSGGQNYYFFNPTSNTEPANITIGSLGKTFNPFYALNGNCGNPNAFPLTTSEGLNCRFNYSATVEDIPSTIRDSGMAKGTFKVSENNTVWAEVLASQYDLLAQYAPPAQPLGISPTRVPTLWNTYVVPYLAAHGETATSATLNYRAVSAGGRTDDWGTLARQIAFGWNGDFSGWELNARASFSHGKATDTAAGGYLDYSEWASAISSGAYDPVLGTGAGSIQGAILHSVFQTTNSDLKTFSLGAQHEVFTLPGGPSIASVGAEYDVTEYKIDDSALFLSQSGFSTQPASTDYPIGGDYGQVPFQADRTNWGAFGEWLFPIESNLDATASVRYDSYAKVHSDDVFSATANPATGLQDQLAPADLGNTFSDTTFKLSFRYTPIDMVSFRGSYGTGFKAPNLNDIAGALTFNGSTSGTYACPFPGSAGCLPGSAQYDLLAGPNGASGTQGLKPEKSKQWTLGVRVEPIPALSLGLDYWNVSLTDQIESQGIAEQVGFNNPSAYASLFVNPYLDPAGYQTIAFEQVPFNGGSAHYSGVDWNFNYHLSFDWGKLSAALTGTQMIKQEYTDGPGLPELTDLGVYGPDQQVVFRTLANLVLSLETGGWVNTLTGHYRSGYTDESYTAGDGVVFLAAPGGGLGAATAFPGLQVPVYVTFDWQTSYQLLKNLVVTAGIRNIGDKSPPLSLQTGGGGNQTGYDGRYYDPTGRTLYLTAKVRF